MKVLVIGGAGFIGYHTINQLAYEDHKIVVVDNLSSGKKERLPSNVSFYNLDINSSRIEEVFINESPEVVIHLAAQVSVPYATKEPKEDANTNIIGTINILELCSKYSVHKIIYASSAAVYGEPQYLGIDESHPVNPINFYGVSKLTPELYIVNYSKLYGLNYTILRYANVYGEYQDKMGEGGVISIFLDNIRNNKPLIVHGDGEQTRDFIHAEEVGKANTLAVSKGDNEIINISRSSKVSINQMIKELKELSQSNIPVQYSDERPGDIKHSYLLNDKAKSKLGFESRIGLKEGLMRFFA